MTVEIRILAPGDEPFFEYIADGVFDYPADRAVLTRYLATPGHHLVVAISENQIVGQVAAVVHRHPDQRPVELYVDEVGVASAFRRRGIARRMLEEMFALGRRLGCTEAWLGTEPENLPAREFYAPIAEPAEDFVMYVFRL